ncbi:hypothetical protein AGABI1DRAFT_57118 [Agaricus bisporus var. burnettii JB137-S8]|uniref:Urease accessory protein UreF n=2 Tax=Agaricus bisporus var. burnettii TaxID=192524 RepID=K5XX69_AGABU|nr:uncharacterized protein AGABI1DRAFT_57118 [Agaricus bisporus var. burnettii JB137-S8]EKM79880.1 hypothetical protein AGABI1DRAFT_57118 [Agaricus bisporus var. burnettii JB137-S8]KAF7775727.1 hypothetical protein Agabi119p4_4120 [Agaricus bisporus var. burnettii]
MDNDDEMYILLLLADSNLPTGSFVASAGLESYVAHGFLSQNSSSSIIDFVQDSLPSYAHLALPFVSDAHRIISTYANAKNSPENNQDEVDRAVKKLIGLDELYEVMTLNHVARRASKAQGIALLTLYSKGFSRPLSISSNIDEPIRLHEARLTQLLDQYKVLIRSEETPGHLPVCWGMLTGALGLTLERSQYLHLFLHARSLLSASVRLNNIGPYGSQQILLHAVRPLVATEAAKCRMLRTGELDEDKDGFNRTTHGPANTWPLGDILAARHDQQHSRIFNS